MIWNFLISIFCLKLTTGQLYEGDSCPLNTSLGVCKRVTDCQVVYRELLAGKMPQSTCGYVSFMPIICCPLDEISTTTSTTTTTTTTQRPTLSEPLSQNNPRAHGEGGSNTSLARQKCREYAASVYTEVFSPVLTVTQSTVNVSLCAIKRQPLIVGGAKADPKEFPHMASVGFNSKSVGIVWACGGSLISDRFVLTAAHCLFFPEYGSAEWVSVGDLILKRTDDDARVQVRKITRRISHPDYKPPQEYHDIALLKMESKVKFDAWVRPACLPSLSQLDGVEKAIATGWGDVEWTAGNGSDHLMKVTLPIVSTQACNAAFGGSTGYQIDRGVIGDWQICAGEPKKDTCQGDSGGPLVVYDNENDCMYDVIGVTSLGQYCGSIFPGIYTRVYHYISWIEEIVWDSEN